MVVVGLSWAGYPYYYPYGYPAWLAWRPYYPYYAPPDPFIAMNIMLTNLMNWYYYMLYYNLSLEMMKIYMDAWKKIAEGITKPPSAP